MNNDLKIAAQEFCENSGINPLETCFVYDDESEFTYQDFLIQFIATLLFTRKITEHQPDTNIQKKQVINTIDRHINGAERNQSVYMFEALRQIRQQVEELQQPENYFLTNYEITGNPNYYDQTGKYIHEVSGLINHPDTNFAVISDEEIERQFPYYGSGRFESHTVIGAKEANRIVDLQRNAAKWYRDKLKGKS